MPTIVFASPKGGVGKSTSAVILATELARRGVGVTVIDADPNRPVSYWARRPGCPECLTVHGDISEANIIDAIEAASGKSVFVIVDLEGTAFLTVAYAISRADLAIIPTQGSQLDAAEAAKAVKLIRQQRRLSGARSRMRYSLHERALPSGHARSSIPAKNSIRMGSQHSRHRCMSVRRSARSSLSAGRSNL